MTKRRRKKVDPVTRAWILDKSDEFAVRNGCWFDPVVGGYAVWWMERYCNLYEGEFAGTPLRLRGLHRDAIDEWDIPDDFDEAEAERRAAHYIKGRNAGDPHDWQFEATLRFFGWQRWSEFYNRSIRRFRNASVWVPKKNKKSPTMSAWGLFVECGDGELGQKVFFGSRDAKQVKQNTIKHCFMMVEASPELSAECKLNQVEKRIDHLPTNSTLEPLTSSNISTQQSKEGLNGSLFIDETHVVDRAFIDRVDRMGISRSEPVHAEFSTAGNDPDSYGKERFEFACKVRDGLIENDSVMVSIYAAPQKLSDEDLAADPLKFGRMANPAWGHTIRQEEYLADYHKSALNPHTLQTFKMYRLNIWSNASTPWLNVDLWDACREDYLIKQLEGRSCFAALDLSSVRDFTSLCLCFPESAEQHRFLWFYFLPEERVREYGDKIPIQSWLQDPLCSLALTPGNVVDYGFVRAKFRELVERFSIRELSFDKWNAEHVTQEMSDGILDANGLQIEKGTGVPRVEFPQSMSSMNEPTKAFEIAIEKKRIRHNGDPLTRWMISNATVKPDANGNYKPLKPDKHSLKKIDGVITAIMSRARAVLNESVVLPDYYETNDVEFV